MSLRRPAADPPPFAAQGEELVVADPERALAVAYAPVALRPALIALFALDERLGAIVGTTSEPMIGLLRLAWWREALERLDAGAAPAEPLLRALAREVLPRGITGAMLAGIEHGWSALLDGEPDAEAITRHGQERGGRLFACAAVLLHAGHDREQVEAAGRAWALADLTHRHSRGEVRAEARGQARAALGPASRRWSSPLRPLGMLVALARRDAAGEPPRRQGSPGRVLRMLALRFTGR